MLDKLSALPKNTLSMIRHMRISGDNLTLSYVQFDQPYQLAAVLRLLPGLRLDQLTVLSDGSDDGSCGTLTGLIADGNGWKTLRYVSCGSEMLGFLSYNHFRRDLEDETAKERQQQTEDWQATLERRDGVASSASVAVYRAKEPCTYGSIVDPARRVLYKPNLADLTLMSRDEHKKEVMVVVKRGAGVDYEEKEDSPLFPGPAGDIRRDIPGMTWPQIRADGHVVYFDDDDNCLVLEDVYSHVDEYTWTPLHFGAYLDDEYQAYE